MCASTYGDCQFQRNHLTYIVFEINSSVAVAALYTHWREKLARSQMRKHCSTTLSTEHTHGSHGPPLNVLWSGWWWWAGRACG